MELPPKYYKKIEALEALKNEVEETHIWATECGLYEPGSVYSTVKIEKGIGTVSYSNYIDDFTEEFKIINVD